MVLVLVGCSRTITGQTGELITMPSMVLKEANHEILPNKPTLEEKPSIIEILIKIEHLQWEDILIQ